MIPNKFAYFSQGTTYRTNQSGGNLNNNTITFVGDDMSIATQGKIFGVRGLYPGTCTTAAGTVDKVATTTPPFPLDANGKPLIGTIVAIKFSYSNSYNTAGTTHTLNVNNTGAYPMYYNNAELVSTTSANTLVAGYANRYIYYMFNGSQWVWLTASYETNSTYSAMSQAEIDAGTGTTGRTITPQGLRNNFYTENEVDTLLAAKVNNVSYDSSSKKIQQTKGSTTTDIVTLSSVATSGSYNDLSNKPTIPTNLSDLEEDNDHITVSITDYLTWYDKQDALVSGTNIKTINETSILGAGNIDTLELIFGYMGTPTGESEEDFLVVVEMAGGMILTSPVSIRDGKHLYIDTRANKAYRYNTTTTSFVEIGGGSSITIDSTITSGGTNPVRGGAIYTALQGKIGYISYQDLSSLDGDTPANGTIGFDEDNANFYIYNGIEGEWFRIDRLVVNSITNGSLNAVTSGAVYTALQGKIGYISYQDLSSLNGDTPANGTIGFDEDEEVFYIYNSPSNEWKSLEGSGGNRILDWTELPWWLNENNNSEQIDDDINGVGLAYLLSDDGIYLSEPYGFTGGGESSLCSVFGVYFTETYEVGYTESTFTSELGKLVDRYFVQRPDLEFPTAPIIWDISNGKVYRLRLNLSKNPPEFKVILRANHSYDRERIYKYPMELGTKIYFKFLFKAEEIPNYINNADEDNPSHWLYRLNMIPVYHDNMVYDLAFISPPYYTSEELMTTEGPIGSYAYILPELYNTATHVRALLTPCLYFNLGTLTVPQIAFRGSAFLPLNSKVDMSKLPIVGRFTSNSSSLSITFAGYIANSISISGNNPEIIRGHTYEYHLMDGVFSLIDITEAR